MYVVRTQPNFRQIHRRKREKIHRQFCFLCSCERHENRKTLMFSLSARRLNTDPADARYIKNKLSAKNVNIQPKSNLICEKSLLNFKPVLAWCVMCSLLLLVFRRGALGYIRKRKTEEEIIQNRKNRKKKHLTKTENRRQNRQKPIQWWQVGHWEQTTLTIISSKYLRISWTCLKPSHLLVSA